jgi:hypothetical protein
VAASWMSRGDDGNFQDMAFEQSTVWLVAAL